MTSYLIRKLLYGMTVLWGVVTLVFIIFSLKPGDPARMLLGQRATPEAIEAVNKELGLDLPLTQRYLLYLNDLSPLSLHQTDPSSYFYYDEIKYGGQALGLGNHVIALKAPYLRRSYKSKRMVSEIIADAIPGTFLLATGAILFALLIGLTIGVISALRKDSLFDKGSLVIAVLGMSAPSFYMAIIISWIGGYLWYETIGLPFIPMVIGLIYVSIHVFAKGDRSWKMLAKRLIQGLLVGVGVWGLGTLLQYLVGTSFLPAWETHILLPGTGLDQSGSLYEVDVFEGPRLALRNIILPMITLGIRPLAIIIQLMRNAMLDELSKDYIRTARAKGLKESRVVVGHAFRNALNPVVTAVSGWFASLLAGAVFIEFVFGWQGLGLQVYNALVNEDFPVVIGSVIVISSIFVLINIGVDILYGIIDPRVRIS
ncbi:MAG: ABC transporter permease [Flavobacteriales bacterium]|nr:ABC transporter permease [Flavobacteriales bacterium]